MPQSASHEILHAYACAPAANVPPPKRLFTEPPAASATVASGATATLSTAPDDVAASMPSAAMSVPAAVSFVSNPLAPVFASAPDPFRVPRQAERPFVIATVSTDSGASVPVPEKDIAVISGTSHASGSACSTPDGVFT